MLLSDNRTCDDAGLEAGTCIHLIIKRSAPVQSTIVVKADDTKPITTSDIEADFEEQQAKALVASVPQFDLMSKSEDELDTLLTYNDVQLGKISRGKKATDKYSFGDNTRCALIEFRLHVIYQAKAHQKRFFPVIIAC